MMRILLFLARTTIGQLLIGWIFSHMNHVLPVKRLHETDTLIAFQHPKPDYPVHILLVPKKAIRGLPELNEDDQEFLQDVFSVTQVLVNEFDLKTSGYRLILNGGKYQEVPQLHFHLIGGMDKSKNTDFVISEPRELFTTS